MLGKLRVGKGLEGKGRGSDKGPITVPLGVSGRSGSHPLRLVSTSYDLPVSCHGRGRVFDGNGIDREQRSSSDRATSPQVPETQGSFLTTVLSTTGFPKAVKPDDHRDVGFAFSFDEELRRITRRKEESTCQPCRILQTLAPDRGCASSQHLHFLVACTGRRLKYYRSASECSCTKRGSPRVGVLGISSNVCTVTVQ